MALTLIAAQGNISNNVDLTITPATGTTYVFNLTWGPQSNEAAHASSWYVNSISVYNISTTGVTMPAPLEIKMVANNSNPITIRANYSSGTEVTGYAYTGFSL